MPDQADSLKTLKDHYVRTLTSIGIERDEAICEAQIVLTTLLNLAPHELLTQSSRSIGPALVEYERVLASRLTRMPLQYALGHTFFMGLRFDVAPGVLIPRPETEHLVESALAHIKSHNLPSPRVFEVGPGSGCICISILKACPHARATAIDISPQALEITRANARHHGVDSRLALVEGDFLSASGQSVMQEARSDLDILISNPPYISPQDMLGLEPEVKDYEPHLALAGADHDGLGFYRALAGALTDSDHTAHRAIDLMVEVGAGQAPAVAEIFAAAGLVKIDRIRDLANIERVVSATCRERI